MCRSAAGDVPGELWPEVTTELCLTVIVLKWCQLHSLAVVKSVAVHGVQQGFSQKPE